jgi:2-polyprenyl-3-methyl-5-hydroxy-6-metoxy-1,4-benzoquinol methylase
VEERRVFGFGRKGGSQVVDEHFVPGGTTDLKSAIAAGDANAVHHLVRYAWAEKVLLDIQPPSVVDLACGAGYGSFQLARRLAGSHVLGIDYDAGAIESAKKQYRAPNLGYAVGDATRWEETIGRERFDCVVAFDMIEHVPHREILMQNVVEHLAANGQLLLSTPCGWDQTRLEPEWEFHRIEYSARSLYDFLRRYFARIVRPEDASFPRRDVFDLLSEGPVTYLLKLNPIVCEGPILVDNPYPGVRA